ncbi:MAG: D-alanyl-D-alanine carboxypeptidase/D-alanyl-D-alanine-endopeptidase, partial [Acidobacteriaceae bacterium]|nr:D-alanyl-D-alanine carboxypeptidase/D-alanyl-D-alanine-endopeptidase [Acidobacteriaceae bacterium]
ETQQTVLATHESHPLSEDVTYTLKVSQNLHAEILLRDVGVAYSCMGSQGAGLTALREYLPHTGIQAGDFVLVDGSGLSSHDLVTPRAVAKLLSFAAHDVKTGLPQPWFAAWKASLPIGGVDGTLADRFTKAPLKGHVFAKTGTLGEARALSGYLDTASGQTVIFSILVGNHLPGTSADRDVMDQIVAAIAASE